MPLLCLAPTAPAANLPVISLKPGTSKTVGRGRQADVQIDDISLSRLHARVTLDEWGQLSVDDLGSTNGIFVNGKEQLTASLQPGDVVRLGRVEYVVTVERGAAGPEEPSAPSPTVLRRVAIDAAPPRGDRLALEALLASSREMMAFEDLPALLERVLDRLASIVKPDRAAILLVDAATGVLIPRAVRPAGAYSSVSEFASSTVVDEALRARDGIVVHDVRMDTGLRQAPSVLLAGVRSVICVPLFGRSGAIGAVYADRVGAEQFSPELAEYVAAFAGHAAAALETAQLYDERHRHFRATLEAFAKALDARDHYTAGHSERVTAYSLVLARQSGKYASDFETIRRAGMLHDIGKVGVPDAVLLKPGALDAQERAVMETHVTIGYQMLAPLPFLGASLPAVRGHHERWDGTGYPDRIAGEDIHPHARIMAVADTYDAITSGRPYRIPLTAVEAARRIRAGAGTQFDPEVVTLFEAVEQEFAALYEDPDAAALRNELVRPGG